MIHLFHKWQAISTAIVCQKQIKGIHLHWFNVYYKTTIFQCTKCSKYKVRYKKELEFPEHIPICMDEKGKVSFDK